MCGGSATFLSAKSRRSWRVASTVCAWKPPICHDQVAHSQFVTEIDRARSSSKVGGFGGAIFGSAAAASSVPPELTPILTSLQTVTKSAPAAKNATKAANTEYEKIQDPNTASSPPALQAARLTGVLKNLASAEGAVTECIKARMELVTALEKILASNREELRTEQEELQTLNDRLADAERKKKEVELIIIGGLPSNESQSAGNHSTGSPITEPDRPQVEALTPPHVQDHDDLYDHTAEPRNGEAQTVTFSSAPGIEMLSNLASHYQAVPVNGSSKKRKIDTSSDFPDLGGDDGIDADVAEMLKDSRS